MASSIQPVEIDPPEAAPAVPRLLRTRIYPGMTGSFYAVVLRIFQCIPAIAALCLMSTTSYFPSDAAFRYLLAAVGLQSIWSMSSGFMDTIAFTLNLRINNRVLAASMAFGDGITSTLTFSAASASAGLAVLLTRDLGKCNVNHCDTLMEATAMAFFSSLVALPSFFVNVWSLAAASVV